MKVTIGIGSDQIRKAVMGTQSYRVRKRAQIQILVEKYVTLIEAEAKDLAPVDSGDLKRSIRQKLGELAGHVVAGAYYARFVELGTPIMAAQPFLVPAWEKYREAFWRDLQKILKQK